MSTDVLRERPDRRLRVHVHRLPDRREGQLRHHRRDRGGAALELRGLHPQVQAHGVDRSVGPR